MNKLLRAYIPLMKYAAIAGLLGGIASFIGPPYHDLLRILSDLRSDLPSVARGFTVISALFSKQVMSFWKNGKEIPNKSYEL